MAQSHLYVYYTDYFKSTKDISDPFWENLPKRSTFLFS